MYAIAGFSLLVHGTHADNQDLISSMQHIPEAALHSDCSEVSTVLISSNLSTQFELG
jgi:hypothetical protein